MVLALSDFMLLLLYILAHFSAFVQSAYEPESFPSLSP